MNKKFAQHIAICLAALVLLGVVWYVNMSQINQMIDGIKLSAVESHNLTLANLQVANLQKLIERLSITFLFLAALTILITLVPAFRQPKPEDTKA